MSTNTGIISGTLYNDDDDDGTHDVTESLTGSGRVVTITGSAGTAKTLSDAKSRYAFTGLAAGRYTLTRVFPAGYRLSNSVTGSIVIDLPEGQSISQDIGSTNKPLPKLGSISGTLYNDTKNVGVMTADSTPTGIRTVMMSSDDGKIIGNVDSTADGKYKLTNLKDGTYRVTRQFPVGYRLSNKVSTPYLRVSIVGGADVTGIDIGTTNAPATDSDPLIKPPTDTGTPPPVVTPTPPPIVSTPRKALIFGLCGMLSLRPDLAIYSSLWTGTLPMWQVMKTAGVRASRDWVSWVGDVRKDVKRIDWDRAKVYHDYGVLDRIVPCLAKEGWENQPMPTPESTKASIQAQLAGVPEWARGLTDWEIGNEFAYVFDPNNPAADYWPGSVKDFVVRVLNPAYEVLHAAGYRVILGGLNAWSPTQLAAVIAAGGKFDVIGHHPYESDPKLYARKTNELTALSPNTPIAETESNSHDGPKVKNDPSYVGQAVKTQGLLATTRETLPQVEAVYEFSYLKQLKTMTGPLGWLTPTIDGKNVAISARTSDLFDLRFGSKFKKAA